MSPAIQPDIISSRTADEHIVVPAKWRAGQYLLIALIALVAGWYATMGYHATDPGANTADNMNPADLLGFAALGAFVWLITPTAWTVATTTFHEAIRRKWIAAVLGFALVMLACSTFFTWMQSGAEQKFLRDFGVGFTVIMTLIVSIFLGVALVPPEIDRRIIFTILSKPVTRLEFLLGKYLGLLMTLALNLTLMATMFMVAYADFVRRKEGSIAAAFATDNGGVSTKGLLFDLQGFAGAFVLHFSTLMIMAAVALLISQLLANITAIIASFVIYFGGQSAGIWEHLTHLGGEKGQATLPPVLSILITAVYTILPRLDRYDVRERLVNDLPIGLNYMLKAQSAGVLYTGAVLAVAYFLFSDREF